MSFLPIVERELRVRSRLKSTHRFRLGGAGLAIIIVSFMLLLNDAFSMSAGFGSGLFHTLAWLAFLYCLFTGARSTADCLSEEKRAGTLGLLFLTDLKGYDVVLGKLAASSLNNFYGLIAMFPPLAIPLLLGGVTAGEYWRLTLALLTTLWFSLTAGLFVSALVRRERPAWGGTLLILLFFSAILPLLSWLPFLPTSTVVCSPAIALTATFDAAYNSMPSRYGNAIVSLHALSAMFLVLASLILPRAWQDRPPRQRQENHRRRSRFWWQDPQREERRRKQLLNLNPILWLGSRNLDPQRFWLWALVTVAGGTSLIAWLVTRGFGPVTGFLIGAALVLHLFLAAWAGWEACQMLAGAKASGAGEMLLCTPLAAKEIVQGHVLALKRLFQGPVLALLAIEMAICYGQIFLMSQAPWGPMQVLLSIAVVAFFIALFLTDLYAAGLFGLWMGLTSRKTSHAFTKTFLYVLVLPWLTAPCWQIALPVIAILKNVVFINLARKHLTQNLRAKLIDHFAAPAEQLPLVTEPKRVRPQLPPVLPG